MRLEIGGVHRIVKVNRADSLRLLFVVGIVSELQRRVRNLKPPSRKFKPMLPSQDKTVRRTKARRELNGIARRWH